MKRKIFLSAIALVMAMTCLAQVQHGYVRTVNRPGSNVQRLSNVSMRFTGLTNSVLSRQDGNFEMVMKGKKNGDAFSLLFARKNGYELLDNNPSYNFSDRQNIEIVMADSRVIAAEKKRIEDKAYRRAEENLTRQLQEADQLLQEAKLSEEAYAKRVKELSESFEKYQQLVGTLADRYARTDYEGLSELDRAINQCIENGDLLRADSLIRSDKSFDLHHAVENKRAAEAEIKMLEENIERQKLQVQKQALHDAERYFQLYTIALTNFQNDSARFFITQRAELDTTNVTWTLEAANFLIDYVTDYDEAERLYERARKVATEQYGEQSEKMAYVLSDHAGLLKKQGRYADVLQMLKESLKIRRKVFGEKSVKVAKCYGNLGIAYKDLDDLKQAEACTQKALSIFRKANEETCDGEAPYLVNLAMIRQHKGRDQKAIDYLNEALPLTIDCKGENSYEAIEIYNMMAAAYTHLDSFAIGEQYYKKAIEIAKRIYGEKHPNVATLHNNIGTLYSNIGQYQEALDHHSEALDIHIGIMGEKNPDVADVYNNISTVFFSTKHYDKAKEYQEEALNLHRFFYGENSSAVANDYQNLAVIDNKIGQSDQALQLAQKAVDLFKEIYGEEHKKTAKAYLTLAGTYEYLKQYDTAITYFQKAIDINQSTLGNNHSEMGTVYNNISVCYQEMGMFDKAQDTLEKTLAINQKAYGKYSPHTAIAYSNIAVNHFYKKEYKKALEACDKSIKITEHNCKGDIKQTFEEVQLKGILYVKMDDYEHFLQVYEDYAKRCIAAYGDNDRNASEALTYGLQKSETHAIETGEAKYLTLIDKFMADKHLTCTVMDGGAAAGHGLKGEYSLLRWSDWDIDNEGSKSYTATYKEFADKPKQIVVMQNGNIEQYDFEETKLGVMNVVKFITPKEKQAIIEAYKTWKQEHAQ